MLLTFLNLFCCLHIIISIILLSYSCNLVVLGLDDLNSVPTLKVSDSWTLSANWLTFDLVDHRLHKFLYLRINVHYLARDSDVARIDLLLLPWRLQLLQLLFS